MKFITKWFKERQKEKKERREKAHYELTKLWVEIDNLGRIRQRKPRRRRRR